MKRMENAYAIEHFAVFSIALWPGIGSHCCAYYSGTPGSAGGVNSRTSAKPEKSGLLGMQRERKESASKGRNFPSDFNEIVTRKDPHIRFPKWKFKKEPKEFFY